MRKWDRTCGLLAVSVLVCGVSGCKSSMRSLGGSKTAPPVSLQSEAETPADLTDYQVADIQSTLARTLEQRGDLKAARAAWGQVLERHPENVQAAWRMGVILDRQGHFGESEEYYRRALGGDSRNVELLCDYGYSLYLQRRWLESERLLTRAAELEPENARVQNNLGLLYAHTERMREAALAFQRAGCTSEESRTNMGVAAAMSGRRDEARRMFERVLEENPESATATRGLEALAAVSDASLGVAGEEAEGVLPASYSTR